MRNDAEEVENKMEQKGNNNIAFQNSTINITVKKLNDRISTEKTSQPRTNNEVAGEMVVWGFGLSLLLAGFLIYQRELLIYSWLTAVFFWSMVVIRIFNLKRKGVYDNLNLQNKMSLIASMGFWLVLGGLMYFLHNPIYQSVQAEEVKAYITKTGFNGVFSRIIEEFIKHPDTVASFVFQSISYITVVWLAIFLILDYLGFSITILSSRLEQKTSSYRMFNWIERKMKRFRLNKSAIAGFSIMILIAFLSGSGVFLLVIEYLQQQNSETLSSLFHK
ncbi:hypothetical protein ABE354_05105 [Brevibacillus laterosporus]|uniref:hypothetical protein n=1 Tax=Brevibacillus laterosporus TaxID=1465 RepID=UPI003D198FDE